MHSSTSMNQKKRVGFAYFVIDMQICFKRSAISKIKIILFLGNANRSSRFPDLLSKSKVTELARQESGGKYLTMIVQKSNFIMSLTSIGIIELIFYLNSLDWLLFRQQDGNRAYIGEPYIDTNKNVGYADHAQIGPNAERQLFMICDMTGRGLKLKDVRNEMSVKIMAQKSHFFNFNYLSADDDDFTGYGRYS